LFFVLTLANSFPVRLSVLECELYLFLTLDNSASDIRIDRIDELALFEHRLGNGFAREEPTKVLDRHFLVEAAVVFSRQETKLLAKDVIEPANLICVGDLQMSR
jgi:hypothetical protein